jgi:NAD(P)-dependent dehydrogenase (short-subunit alcohol dehydrogenase family)
MSGPEVSGREEGGPVESHGRVAVVTGGASGIGRAIAERFARDGDRVIVADIDAAGGAAAVDAIVAAGGRAAFRRCDVAVDGDIRALFDGVEAEFGAIDVLVNSAGILQDPRPIEDVTMEEYDRVHAVNVRGLYVCCREVAPRMTARRRGVILNIASNTSLRAYPLLPYGPGKVAVSSLTGILAAELGPHYVRVNAVAPTATLTPGLQKRIDAGERDPDRIVGNNAIPKMLMPADVADAAAFLCSDRARAISGVTMPVDYGWQVWLSYRAYPS